MTSLSIPDPVDRADLGAFIARVVRLDQMAVVRLRSSGATLTAWASTPFDVLATRSVPGSLDPGDVTVPAVGLLTALTVERAETVDPGAGGLWPGELPPTGGWSPVDAVPAAELEGLTARGLAVARENAGPLGPPASLLDQTVLTVTTAAGRAGPAIKVPLRCLFALSGMGFLGDAGLGGGEADDNAVRVSATGTWMRLDARYGAVVRRRLTALPLLIGS